MTHPRSVLAYVCAALVCAGAFSTAKAQDARRQIQTFGTTVLVSNALVLCKYLEASDAEIIIADERRKLTGFDPGELNKITASAKRQATAQTTAQTCARVDRQIAYQMQQVARRLRNEGSAQHASTPPTNNAQDRVNKSYVDCLTSNVQSGRFRSMEINRATLELTVACVDQREAFAQQCTISGRPFRVPYCEGSVCVKTELEECRLRAGFLAAMAIKLQEHNDLVEQLNAATRAKSLGNAK